MKSKPAKPKTAEPPVAAGKRVRRPNAQLNRQNRKVMGQHYRAKYGVK